MSFSSITIEGKRASPDRMYYNGTVINNTLTSTQQADDPTVRFQDQRQVPILLDASSYEMQVQNFSLNGCPKTLPLFIPQINPATISVGVTQATVNSAGPNQTVTYTCTQSLKPGNYVKAITGFLYAGFNFDYPRKVIASTSTTFTIATENLIYPQGETTAFATALFVDPTDVTTTIYTVSVAIGAPGPSSLISTVPIIWVPENQTPYTIVPTTANPVQEETDYYYDYTYTHWVGLVNTALNTAWLGAGGTTAGTQCPFLEYDETTGLFTLNQDSNTCMVPYGTALPQPYNVTSVSTSASGGTYGAGEYSFVGMNTCLELLLTNFASTYFSANRPWASTGLKLPEVVIDMGLPINLLTGSANTDIPVGKALRTQPRSSIFQLVNPFTGTAIANAFFARLPQDYKSTGGGWSPIASFVLVTSKVPVRNEASANPITFGSANIGPIESGGAFQKVLLEAPIEALSADIWRGSVLYEPKVEIYSSLDPSNKTISDIDVSLFWRNRLTNSLVPVHIPNQGSMTFRLLFKRKTAM